MTKAKYEVTCIIKPDTGEDSKKASIDRFGKVVTSNGAEKLESKDRGKRRSVYEIEKYREDIHHIMTFVAENSEPVDEFGHFSCTNSQVLRSTIVKLDR